VRILSTNLTGCPGLEAALLLQLPENATMRTKNVLLLCGFLLMPSLVMAHDVMADFDRSAAFYKYQTFMWAQEPEPCQGFMKERIINAVTAELQARGLRLVTSNADLAVSAASDSNDIGIGFYADLMGGWNWYQYWAPAPSMKVLEILQSDALVVRLIDSQTDTPVWWAVGFETIREKSEKHPKNLNKHVHEMFEYLPPVAASNR
jgi:uncharacterized protein DUF4136